MMANMALPNHKFRLQKQLNAAQPFRSLSGIQFYDGVNVLGQSLHKLIYFGVSVFWRASVHMWTLPDSDNKIHIDLGKYREGLRTFLLGGAFPSHVGLTISVASESAPVMAAFAPFEEHKKQYHYFVFYIPGVEFQLNVGKQIPEAVKAIGVQAGPNHPILLSPHIAQRVAGTARDLKMGN
jgi:hypothetical protein